MSIKTSLQDSSLLNKWSKSLQAEMKFVNEFESYSHEKCSMHLKSNSVLSTNYDTVVSLDFPHYCYGATLACGGPTGWCYTFQCRHNGAGHQKKTAFVDMMARRNPENLAEKIISELNGYFRKGVIYDLNLRYNGSGEMLPTHVPLIKILHERGVNTWGFTRNLSVAKSLFDFNIPVIFSADSTSDRKSLDKAVELGLPLAYTSVGVDDLPYKKSFVVFPLHQQGSVEEVADLPGLCPKVVEEFFVGKRRAGYCQDHCRRCHQTIG